MKVQQSLGISQERLFPMRERGRETVSFQSFVQEKQISLSQNRLNALLGEIDQQGTQLNHSRTLQNLMTYKQKVKEFVKEVVQHGLLLEEQQGYNPNGREKRLKLIKVVDQKLLELSDHVLEKQDSSIDLLAKTGEIKGLLLNLYL